MSNRLIKALEEGQITPAAYIRGCVGRHHRAGFDSLLEGTRQAVQGLQYTESYSRADSFKPSGGIANSTLSLLWMPTLPEGDLWDGPWLELSPKGLTIRGANHVWCGHLPVRRLDQADLAAAMIRGAELYVLREPHRNSPSTRSTLRAENEGWKNLRPLVVGRAAHEDLFIGVQTAIDVYLSRSSDPVPVVTYNGHRLSWILGEIEIRLDHWRLEALDGDRLLFQLPPRISEVQGRRHVSIARLAVLGALHRALHASATPVG